MPHRGQFTRAAVALLIALLAGVLPGRALADGDPASDVLAGQSVFFAADAGISPGQELALEARLRRDAAAGHPLRVAVIASPADLGSVSAAFGRPAAYANFLGYELSSVYRGRLLVVMPAGLAEVLVTPARRVPVPVGSAGGGSLAQRTLTAVGAGQVGSGAALAGSTGSSSPLPWIVFVAGLLLVLAAWAASLRARPIRRLGAPRAL